MPLSSEPGHWDTLTLLAITSGLSIAALWLILRFRLPHLLARFDAGEMSPSPRTAASGRNTTGLMNLAAAVAEGQESKDPISAKR